MQHLFFRFRRLSIIPLLALSVTFALAQPRPLNQYSDQQKTQQIALQKTLTQLEQANYQLAQAEAIRLKRPLIERLGDGTVRMLRGITERGELLYETTYSNLQAGITTKTNALYAGGSLGLSLSGSTLTDKLGIWDGGKVRSTHVEFRNTAGASRVTQIDNASTFDSHASHVSGTLIAAGVNPSVRGMAYGTNLRAYDFSNDVSEMTVAAPNLLLSNHSYGTQAGWVFNDSRTTTTKWEWWGDTTVSQTEDYKFGLYDSRARNWDQIAYNAPYYLIVKSAGNSHGDNGPGAGQPYYIANGTKTVTTPRASQDGYDQVATNSTSKNILSIAAVGILPNGYNQPADVSLASFSSWGPTDDGRIKPDLSGVGVNVLSSSSESDSAYVTYSGTSMASPNVTGSLLLLQELYGQRNSGKFMRASTLKAVALHTANEAGPAPGPDYKFGWGLLNMERAGQLLLNTGQNHLLSELTLAQGATYSLTVVASGRGPLTGTIAWTDPAGIATSALNDRTIRLVNDLDLRISTGSATTQPWILDPSNPANPATRGDNIRDNVEQVLVSNPIPGQTYTITVSHKGTLTGNTTSSQDYALVLSGIGGTAYCASAPTSTADTRIDRLQFGSIDQTGSTGYTNNQQATTTIQAGQVLPLVVTTGTCGAAKPAVVKAFADWNQDGDFDDAGELLTTSPVLNGPTTFTGSVTVPTTVQSGQFIRLRVVATETSSADQVTACGSYGNGETQDYTIQVVQTANDVAVAALLSPAAGFCGQISTGTTVTVQLRNNGTAVQQNIPVSVRILDASNTEVATLTGTVPTLAAFRDRSLSLQLPATVLLQPGQTYQFQITATLPADQNPGNNSLTVTRTASPAPASGIFSATRCGSDTLVSLVNGGGETAFWYDAPTGGNLLAAGNRTSARLPGNGVFYATLNDFSGGIGPVSKSVYGGGSYAGNFGPAPLVSTTVPVLIESARLYIGNAGKLTFTVRKFDETAISSVTLDVTPTRNQSLTATSNGQLVDDPNDPGAVYPLNLSIPAAGDYKITIEYAEGASIFRSNVGVSGFPYRLNTQQGKPIVSIRGSLFNNSTGGVDTLKAAWYYFYDLRVRSLNCPAAQRTAVTPIAGTGTTAVISADGSTSVCQGGAVTLRANTGPNLAYQWYRGGQLIAGATASTYAASVAGNYVVQVAGSCLPVSSSAVTVTIRTAVTPTITTNGFTLSTNVTGNTQWLLNGVAIAGATSSTYVVTQTGRYSVKGSVNGCGELTSDEVYLAILAAEPQTATETLSVYPNPVSSQVEVSLSTSATLQQPAVRVVNQQGIPLLSTSLTRSGTTYSATLDLNRLPAGSYLLVVGDDKNRQIQVRRVVKQ